MNSTRVLRRALLAALAMTVMVVAPAAAHPFIAGGEYGQGPINAPGMVDVVAERIATLGVAPFAAMTQNPPERIEIGRERCSDGPWVEVVGLDDGV